MSSSSTTLNLSQDLALLHLNQPGQLNCFSLELLTELQERIEWFRSSNVRCLVLTGRGRAFSTGADLKLFVGYSTQEKLAYNRRLLELFGQLAEIPMPVIAAINGYALGGGLELAMSCTMRIAATNAVLGLPEVTLGILPGAGGARLLPRLVGESRALRLLLTGDTVTGSEAAAMGLVSEAVPSARLVDVCMEIARRIAASAPLAVKAIMDAVRFENSPEVDPESNYTQRALERLLESRDAKEGIAAFLEKRKASFVGG